MEPPFKIYQYYLKNTLKPLAYVLNWFHKHIMEETCYEKNNKAISNDRANSLFIYLMQL